MSEEEKTINLLSEKINDVLARFVKLKEQNEILRQESITLRAQNEAKDIEIAKLEEDLLNKNIESEDIFARIEEVLRS